MGDNQSWRTAYISAAPRLIEQYEPKEMRLFKDSFVKNFHNKISLFAMQYKILRDVNRLMLDFFSKGAYGLIICRTRYIDDLLQRAIDNGIEQVVILGAGLDTRPYRMKGIHNLKVFEVDLPIMQNIKKEKISKCLGALHRIKNGLLDSSLRVLLIF